MDGFTEVATAVDVVNNDTTTPSAFAPVGSQETILVNRRGDDTKLYRVVLPIRHGQRHGMNGA